MTPDELHNVGAPACVGVGGVCVGVGGMKDGGDRALLTGGVREREGALRRVCGRILNTASVSRCGSPIPVPGFRCGGGGGGRRLLAGWGDGSYLQGIKTLFLTGASPPSWLSSAPTTFASPLPVPPPTPFASPLSFAPFHSPSIPPSSFPHLQPPMPFDPQ